MKPEYTAVLKFILGSIKSIDKLPNAVGGFFSNIGAAFSSFNKNERYIDMRGGEEEICTAMGLNFWIGTVFGAIGIVTGLLTSIFASYDFGILAFFGDIFGFVISTAISLLITAVLVYFATTYAGAWNSIIAKVYSVLIFIGLIFNIIGAVRGIIRVFGGIGLTFVTLTGGLVTIIAAIFMILEALLSAAIATMSLNGLAKGLGYNR